LNKATDETAEPILMCGISKYVFSWEVRTFWGQSNNFTILGVKIPKNSQKLARIGISKPNLWSRIIAICRSLMKVFASYFTDRLKTRSTTQNLQN